MTESAANSPAINSASNRLDGQRIVVTGSSRGIGAEIARRLAVEGARVVVTYAGNAQKAQAVAEELSGDGHISLPLDIANEQSVESFFSEVAATGGLTGLVNNAGLTRDQLILRMKTEDFDQVIGTNLRGAFLCTRAAIKMMFKQKTKGSIVSITSVIGEMGNAGQSNYAASKAGVEGMMKSLAKEVASRGIRLNCIAPGFIQTDMTAALTSEQKERISSGIPLGYLGEPKDVAAAAAFLLSDDARYITGHTLSVNGGLYI